jgi:hypothetical protein
MGHSTRGPWFETREDALLTMRQKQATGALTSLSPCGRGWRRTKFGDA